MADTAELASLGERFAARAIDSLVAYAPVFVAALSAWATPGFIRVYLLGLLYAFAYLCCADALGGGQSVGKRLLELCVVDERSLERCSLMQSFVRNFCLAFGVLDLIFLLGSGRQRLGDRVASTIVIRVRAGAGVRGSARRGRGAALEFSSH